MFGVTGGIGECGEEGTGMWWEVDVGSIGVHWGTGGIWGTDV